MMGVSGLAGDPAYPPKTAADAAAAARQVGRAVGQGDEPARLALVALRHHHRHHRLRRPRALHQPRPLHAGLRAGRQGLDRHHLLAACDPRRRRVAHAVPGSRNHRRRTWHGLRRDLLRRRRQRAFPARRSRHPRLQRRRHPAPDAEFGVGEIPQRHRQFHRAGRQEPDVPPLCADLRLCRRAARRQSRSAALPVEPGILRDRSAPRFRARLHLSVRPRRRRDHGGDRQHQCGPAALGRGPSRGLPQTRQPPHRTCRRSARICPRSTTA